MGLTKYLREAWKKPDMEVLRARMVEWRAGGAFTRVEKPLRLNRARALGYKAKNGVIVVRVRLLRGGHKRTRPYKARRTKRLHIRKNLTMNYKEIAEQRAGRAYSNMEVLNSYQVGKDGQHYYFEVILVDPSAPEIASDKDLGYLANSAHRGRVFRGLTSAGIRARGLRNSSIKAPKVRPSLRAKGRLGN